LPILASRGRGVGVPSNNRNTWPSSLMVLTKFKYIQNVWGVPSVERALTATHHALFPFLMEDHLLLPPHVIIRVMALPSPTPPPPPPPAVSLSVQTHKYNVQLVHFQLISDRQSTRALLAKYLNIRSCSHLLASGQVFEPSGQVSLP
jgi:hypothetical protein